MAPICAFCPQPKKVANPDWIVSIVNLIPPNSCLTSFAPLCVFS